jgi:lipopolysaccharide export system protein LptC
MRNRRVFVWLAILVAAAAITQLLVWWLRPPSTPVALVGPPRSSYELDDFTLYAFGQNGQLAFRMSAPHLARREGTGGLYVNAPTYFFVASDGATWHGTSQYAWISANNKQVKLVGNVDMQRPADRNVSKARIRTADATVWTQDKRMVSAAPSVIQQPGSILRGTGIKANFDTRSVQLLSQVHGTFKPPPKPEH